MSGKSASAAWRPEARSGAATGSALRIAVLAAAMLAMAAALAAGLARLGLPLTIAGLAELHGPLMVCGVFATVIALERAVALGSGWAFLAPLSSAVGAAFLLFGATEVGAVLFLLSAAVLVVASLRILILQPALFTAALLAGAFSLFTGNLALLAGAAVPDLAAWWLAFFVATIAAERLELGRVLRPPPHVQWLFLAILLTMLAGAGFGLLDPAGRVLTAASFVALGIWLFRYDVAMRTVRTSRQARFGAVAMLAGYVWLAAAGGLLLVHSGPYAYDMVLHAVLIGFVLSMVFAHVLVILPAVTGIRLRYHPGLYAPLLLLHASLAVRLVGGLIDNAGLRQAGGVTTVVALLLLALVLVRASARQAAAR